jgi:hypothetical protein
MAAHLVQHQHHVAVGLVDQLLGILEQDFIPALASVHSLSSLLVVTSSSVTRLHTSLQPDWLSRQITL